MSRAERAEVTIRIAFLASSDDEDYVGAMAFKQSVEAAAGGRVAVQVFPSGQYCGSERECIEALQGGMLEMHQTTFGGLAALFGPAQALDLPYTFVDDAVAECVMDGPLLAQMGDAILEQGLGLRLMAVGNTGGWRSFATTRQRIQSPADLAQLRIRTLPSALEQEMVRALGASPTPLPWSEVYYALSAGLLDGTKNSVQDVVGMKLHEHVRFLFVDRHSYMGAMWWYSERQWQALPPDLQAHRGRGLSRARHRDPRGGRGAPGTGVRGLSCLGRRRRRGDAGAARGIPGGDARVARLVCEAVRGRVAGTTGCGGGRL